MKKHAGLIVVLLSCLFLQASKGEKIGMETMQIRDDLTLKYLIREPLMKTVKRKAIILLHGIGSNEEDLFGLANQLPAEYFVIAARGKYTLGAGSYAWYQVDFSTGKPVYNLAQELESRKAILRFMEEVKEKYHLDGIILGGFSQGAIMSYSVGLLHPEKVKGIFCLSGRLLQEIRSEIKANTKLQQLPIFIAHGTQDQTLSIDYAREAKMYLEKMKLKINYHEYPMGHSVVMEEIKELNKWFHLR